MKKIRVMIVGYGNVGRGVRLSLGKNPDMELVGIVSRSPERVGKELPDVPVMAISDVEGWKKAFRPDVAILCGGSKRRQRRPGTYRSFPPAGIPVFFRLSACSAALSFRERGPTAFTASAKRAGSAWAIPTRCGRFRA